VIGREPPGDFDTRSERSFESWDIQPHEPQERRFPAQLHGAHAEAVEIEVGFDSIDERVAVGA
jgi:hypothetical protein